MIFGLGFWSLSLCLTLLSWDCLCVYGIDLTLEIVVCYHFGDPSFEVDLVLLLGIPLLRLILCSCWRFISWSRLWVHVGDILLVLSIVLVLLLEGTLIRVTCWVRPYLGFLRCSSPYVLERLLILIMWKILYYLWALVWYWSKGIGSGRILLVVSLGWFGHSSKRKIYKSDLYLPWKGLYLEILHYKGKILLGFLPLWVSQVILVSLILCSSWYRSNVVCFTLLMIYAYVIHVEMKL